MRLEAFLEKILFWKKKRNPKYTVHHFEDAIVWVEIESGPYSGVSYSYGKVKFSEELGYPKLEFSFTILNPGKHTEEDLQDDAGYVTMMGDILMELIIKNESTGKDYPEELGV